MSWVSKWIDEHITHSSERREAKERADTQMAEYRRQQGELKAEREKLKAQKEYEAERMQRKQMRRLKAGIRQRSFGTAEMDSTKEALG